MEDCVKSSEKSTRLRESGNQFYAQRHFFDAMLKYNESLCFAERESENAGLVYANRSAVYFEMRLFDNCLRNIELARTNKYPEKNFEILKKREVKCRELMKNTKKSQNSDASFFKLSHEGHKQLPSILSCLELKSDKKYGRHIVTKRDLAVGEVIAIDEPFCKVLQSDFLYQHCANCFNSNLLDLMPCFACSQAMFCDENCSQSAHKNFHRFECAIMHLLTSSLVDENMRIALRTFFMSLALFDDSIESLEKFLDEHVACTVFDSKTELNVKQKLASVNSLVFDEAIKVNEGIFDEIFQLDSKLKELWLSHKDFIKKFLRKHTQIASLNCHEIYGWPLKRGGLIDPEIEHLRKSLAYQRGVVAYGSGSFPFAALLNHSCAPNVTKVFVDEKIAYIVQRKIAAGEQLFDNYGFSFTNVPRDFRRGELLERYRFKCNCSACINDFALLPSLGICDKRTFAMAKKTCAELSTLTQKKARQKVRELAETLQRNHKNFPSLEICSLMESFSACLEISLKPDVLF